MKVTSTKSISFPKLGWAISAGETKELPEDEVAQKRILAEPEVTAVEGKQENFTSKSKKDNK